MDQRTRRVAENEILALPAGECLPMLEVGLDHPPDGVFFDPAEAIRRASAGTSAAQEGLSARRHPAHEG